MSQLLQFESGGGAVMVEVADDEPGIERAARVDEVVIRARDSLESAAWCPLRLAKYCFCRTGSAYWLCGGMT
jgi:hypothetical protein